MGIHDGHRDRMRRRFVETGLEGFNDHNVLELLLFYAVPRKDTNELAHRLIKTFGSLSEVFEASFAQLVAVDGIGEAGAALIKLVPEIGRRYLIDKSLPADTVSSSDEAGRYFVSRFMFEKTEQLYALMLDSANRVIACRSLSSGSVNSTELSIRLLVETAIKHGAAGVIVAHNHPGAPPTPSEEDETCNYRIASALSLVNINFLAHIIVSGSDYTVINKQKLM